MSYDQTDEHNSEEQNLCTLVAVNRYWDPLWVGRRHNLSPPQKNKKKIHTKAEDGLEFAFGDCRGNGFNIYAFWVHSALNPMDFVFVCFVSLLSHSLYFFYIFFNVPSSLPITGANIRLADVQEITKVPVGWHPCSAICAHNRVYLIVWWERVARSFRL